MTSLSEFLDARLAEEAEKARAARTMQIQPWSVFLGADVYVNSGSIPIATVLGSGVDPDAAAHIALQDPQATLDRIDATRLIVAMHRQMGPTPSWRRVWCLRCSTDEAEIKWPCPTMRALAWTWRRHPSWQQSWAPDGVSVDAPR